jgi:hypothetical protein
MPQTGTTAARGALSAASSGTRVRGALARYRSLRAHATPNRDPAFLTGDARTVGNSSTSNTP